MKFIVFVLVTLLLAPALGKKKRESVKDKIKRLVPSDVSPELLCDACIAIVKESEKRLFGKKSESDVFDVMEQVCDPERYYVYSRVLSRQSSS